ncbi:MAG: class II aldolase/adducin family protein, partial [Pseudomonadota bacterium]
IMGREIPAVHYMVAVFGGPVVRCAPYATYGTAELSAFAVEAIKDRSACLLAHHGVIVGGESLSKAMWLAVELETLAAQYVECLQMGNPPVLDDDEIERVKNKIESGSYGASS